MPQHRVHADQDRLIAYWESKKFGRTLPAWERIDLLDLPQELLSNICIIRIQHSSQRYEIKFAGNGFYDAYDMEITGLFIDEFCSGDTHDYWIREYHVSMTTARPALGTTDLSAWDKAHMTHIWLRLPFGESDGRVMGWLGYDLFLPSAQVAGLIPGTAKESP